MSLLKVISKRFNKWWDKPDWQSSTFDNILRFWIASVMAVGFLTIMFAPVVGIFGLAFWLIWR